MRAAWWWIDRWRTSGAYATLTMAEQGAYRNLLDELWLRGGLIPADDRLLERASGAGSEWPGLRDRVMAHFVAVPGGYRHAVHDEVAAESAKRAARQKKWRESRNVTHNVTDNASRNVAPSLDLSQDQDQDQSRGKKETPSESCRREPTTPKSLPPLVVMWNEKVAGTPLKSVRLWSSKRDRVLKARLREEGDLAVWGVAMDHLIASDFHRGVNDQGWVAGLDFLLQPGQAPKWLDLAHGGPPVKADPEVTPQLRRLMGGV